MPLLTEAAVLARNSYLSAAIGSVVVVLRVVASLWFFAMISAAVLTFSVPAHAAPRTAARINATYAPGILPTTLNLSLLSTSASQRRKASQITWILSARGVTPSRKKGARVRYQLERAGSYTVRAVLPGGSVVSKRLVVAAPAVVATPAPGVPPSVTPPAGVPTAISTVPGIAPTVIPPNGPTSIPVSSATPTVVPTVTPTPEGPIVQCSGARAINIDFSQSSPSSLGTLTNARAGIGSIEPTSEVVAPPLLDSSALFQLNFEGNTQPGADSGPTGIPFLCTGAACPTISAAAGRIGSGATFSGTQGVAVPLPLERLELTNQNFTWSAWFRSSSADLQTIIGSYCGFGHLSSSLKLQGGQLALWVDPAELAGTNVVSNRTGLSDGQWHHVAAVRTASTGVLQLYIDGVLDRQVTGPVQGGDLTCGLYGIGMNAVTFPATSGFKGALDAVTMYDRAFSATEIQRLASASALRGTFTSRQLNFSAPVFQVEAALTESTAAASRIEVSTDGQLWCALSESGELVDPTCALPTTRLWYRVQMRDSTAVQQVDLTANCTPSCIDADGDGASAISSTTSFCQKPQLDCDDTNEFIFPANPVASCTCGGTPATEICNDGIDNDCDGAVDVDDNSCYQGGSIYYLSQSRGKDSNAGTSPQAPLKSIEVGQAVLSSRFRAGDKMLLKRGDTWTTGSFYILKTGTAQAPITLGSYGAGERPRMHLSGSRTAVTIRGSQYIQVKDLHVTRTSLRAAVFGVGFDAQVPSNYVTLDNIHLDTLSYGILVNGDNFLIQNSIVNDCENSQVPNSGHAQGLWVFDGSDYGIVRNNIFDNNGKYRVILDHNVYLGGGNYWLFEGNEFSGDSGTSIVFHGNQRGHIIRGNVFTNNTANMAVDISNFATGYLLTDFIVEQNKFINNPGGGFWIREAVNLIVRNNIFQNSGTIFNVGAAPTGSPNETTGFLAEHNTFYGNRGLFSSNAPVAFTMARNIFDSGTVSLTNGGSLVSIENLPAATNPRFVNPALGDFRLQASSPAIDAATSLGATADYLGNARPFDGNGDAVARSDLGAYEYRP